MGNRISVGIVRVRIVNVRTRRGNTEGPLQTPILPLAGEFEASDKRVSDRTGFEIESDIGQVRPYIIDLIPILPIRAANHGAILGNVCSRVQIEKSWRRNK